MKQSSFSVFGFKGKGSRCRNVLSIGSVIRPANVLYQKKDNNNAKPIVSSIQREQKSKRMITPLRRLKVSTVTFVLVLTFAASFIACLPAVIADAVVPTTAILWVTINLAVISQLVVNGFFSSAPVRLAQLQALHF